MFIQMIIPDKIETLSCLHDAICQWQGVAEQRLLEFGNAMEAKRNAAWSEYDFDPAREQATLLGSVEDCLFGSLSVAIASTVEDVLGSICGTINATLPNRPTWGDKRNAIERRLNLSFASLPGFADVTLARLTANCFKHKGGEATADFSAEYGVPEGSRVEMKNNNWPQIIHHTESFLMQLASHL